MQIFSLLLPEADFPPKIVSCFDEAFNRICKQKQMDVHVIFFDSNKQLDLSLGIISWAMLAQRIRLHP